MSKYDHDYIEKMFEIIPCLDCDRCGNPFPEAYEWRDGDSKIICPVCADELGICDNCGELNSVCHCDPEFIRGYGGVD